jgi:diketogulonate reductase-like aldo/keto reductase
VIEGILDDTLAKLGTNYLDLYLVHWYVGYDQGDREHTNDHFSCSRPVATYPDKEGYDEELTANPYPTWQKLEEMVESGKIRNIGLSKYVQKTFRLLDSSV